MVNLIKALMVCWFPFALHLPQTLYSYEYIDVQITLISQIPNVMYNF